MNAYSKISQLATMLILSETLNKQNKNQFFDLDQHLVYHKPKDDLPKPANGCQQYFFNKNGGFRNDNLRKDECVFKCNALNKKSAFKKFKNWENNL